MGIRTLLAPAPLSPRAEAQPSTEMGTSQLAPFKAGHHIQRAGALPQVESHLQQGLRAGFGCWWAGSLGSDDPEAWEKMASNNLIAAPRSPAL